MAIDEPDHRREIRKLADDHRVVYERADRLVTEMERHNALLRETINDSRPVVEIVAQDAEGVKYTGCFE